jgi:outer membrane protein
LTPFAGRRAKTALGLALLLGAGVRIGAAPPVPPDRPLTLKECVRTALANNPGIASSLHSGRASLARVGSSRSAYYPTVDFGAGLSRSYLEPQGFSAGGGAGQTSDSASLSAQVTIWDSGQRKASVGGADASYQASDARFQSAAQDLASSVQSAYFTVQGARWALTVSQDTLKQADFHLDLAKARNEVGLAPRSDVLKAATAQADARLSVIQAESALATARSNLAILMGMPADFPIEVEMAERDAPLPALPDWAMGWERAKETLPELRAARMTTESSRFSLLEAQASYMPTVTADGGVGLLDAGNWPDRRQWSVGISLRVPVFTGYARKFQILQAKESWEGSKADLRSSLLSAEGAAYSARISLNRSIQSVEAAKAYLASAQENSDVAEGQYQNGLGSMLDVVDAATELSSAKLRLVSARLSVATAQVAWERATGTDLLEGADLPSTQSPSPDGDARP